MPLTAKQYLSQALFLRSAIRRTELQIEEIRSRMQSAGAIRYDKLNVQTSPHNDTMVNFMIQMEKAEKKSLDLMGDYYSTYASIQTQINAVQPDIYRQILSMRYLDGCKLERIADRLSYSDVYVRKLHGRALQAFSRQFLEGGAPGA